MELLSFSIPKTATKFVLAPLGDFQYSGQKGPTAKDTLKRHIEKCLKMEAFFFGMGDYNDFLSPSNRKRLMSADLYDSAKDVIAAKAYELAVDVYEEFLKPTTGRWIGMLEGHHYYQRDGQTTDQHLAEMLKTKFVGTSVGCRIPNADFTFWAHHGTGGGITAGAAFNRLQRTASEFVWADVYMMGHTTKMGAMPLSRPWPIWGKSGQKHDMIHKNYYLVSTGGFSKSNIIGHRDGTIPRGEYAEQRMLGPSPLSAPIITVDIQESWPERLSVLT
jgi:hypothetical protein